MSESFPWWWKAGFDGPHFCIPCLAIFLLILSSIHLVCSLFLSEAFYFNPLYLYYQHVGLQMYISALELFRNLSSCLSSLSMNETTKTVNTVNWIRARGIKLFASVNAGGCGIAGNWTWISSILVLWPTAKCFFPLTFSLRVRTWSSSCFFHSVDQPETYQGCSRLLVQIRWQFVTLRMEPLQFLTKNAKIFPIVMILFWIITHI